MHSQFLMYKHVRKETPYEAYSFSNAATSSRSRKSSRKRNASNTMKKS